MKRSVSLLLITCCLFAVIQTSISKSGHSEKTQNPQVKDDLDHQEEAGAPKESLKVSEYQDNGTETSGEAKFVRLSDAEGELSEASDETDDENHEEGVPSGEVKGEKDEENEDDAASKKEKAKKEERLIVTHIPELPASIAKPGRLFNSSWFIMFYASWCEHSQRAEPEFLKALQMIADSNLTGMYIGKIDVTNHGEVAKHFKIKGTPTFAFFKFGVRFDYIEAVSAKNLFEFAAKILTSKVDQVNTTQQLTDLTKNHSVLFLLVHDEEIDADWHTVYMRIASEKALDAKFAYTTDPELVKEHGITRLPCIMVLKDGKAFLYSSALSGYSLSRWITIEKYLTFPTVNESNLLPHLYSVTAGRRLAILVVHSEPSERRITQKKSIEVVKRVALSRKLHTKFQFLLLEGAELAEKLIGWSVGLPTLFVYEPHTGLYYMYESGGKAITEESLNGFLRNITTGVLSPQGGASLLDSIIYVGRLAYAVVMTMVTHRPVLSAAAILSLLGVSLFYLIVFCQKKLQKNVPKSSRALAKKAALKRRREEARKETTGGGKGSSMRKRNRRDDTGIESDEMSQSDVRTGTGSGTGTQSEGEFDSSQVELSDREETKKEK